MTIKAAVGLTDITVCPMTEADMLSFSVLYKMFLEMEENVDGAEEIFVAQSSNESEKKHRINC